MKTVGACVSALLTTQYFQGFTYFQTQLYQICPTISKLEQKQGSEYFPRIRDMLSPTKFILEILAQARKLYDSLVERGWDQVKRLTGWYNSFYETKDLAPVPTKTLKDFDALSACQVDCFIVQGIPSALDNITDVEAICTYVLGLTENQTGMSGYTPTVGLEKYRVIQVSDNQSIAFHYTCPSLDVLIMQRLRAIGHCMMDYYVPHVFLVVLQAVIWRYLGRRSIRKNR